MPELHQRTIAALRQASRRLWRARGFSLVTVLTLGLGIGACTAIYTVVYGVLLQPLPYVAPDRLVHLNQISKTGNLGNFSDPNYEDIRDQSRSFAALAEYASGTVSVVGGSVPVRTRMASVSSRFFEVLPTSPVLGRLFLPDEQRLGGAPAVLVSYGFWQSALGGARDLTNRTLTFDQRTFTVIGVLPPSFRFPAEAELWTARELEERYPSRTAHNWRVVGRLSPAVTLAQARDDVRAIARRLKAEHGDGTWMVDAAVTPLRDALVGSSRSVLLLLLGAVGFLLLVAAANVVNLLLARAASRQREAAVRAALGATRGQQVAPFLAESALLAAGGCLLGLLAAFGGVRLLLTLEPEGIPRLDEVQFGWPVLLFACAASAGLALVLGLFAGWRAMRLDPQATLKDGQLSQAGGGSGARLRDGLVVVQLAMSVMLLVGAGLLARSFLRLLDQQPGFRTSHIVTMELAGPPAEGEEGRARRARFHDELVTRTRSLPGVLAAGGANALPLEGRVANGTFLIVDGEPPTSMDGFAQLMRNKEATGFADYVAATDGYFRTMGIPLVRGRWFEPGDTANAPHVAVISESLAKTRWPDRDPIGLRLEFGNMDGDLRLITIVGIVGDVRYDGLDRPAGPAVYVNARQRPAAASTFILAAHSTADPAWLMARVREIARALDPDVPPRLRTIEQVFASSIANRRYSLWLVVAFALAALALAVIGVYGVVSYAVAQRTRELGVRMALGARPAQVARLVLNHGARLTLVGLALGAFGALAVTRFMRTLLFEVAPTDPITYAIVAASLALAAFAACQIPALRASRVDPLKALRTEL